MTDKTPDKTLKTAEERQKILAELPARMPPLDKLRAERRAKRRVNKRRRRPPTDTPKDD